MADQSHGDPSLPGLPPELIEEVATQPPLSDLINLRLVCRELSEKTLLAFSRKGFTNKTFLLLWPKSLNVLLEISKHPFFSRSIKQINLCLHQVGNYRLHDISSTAPPSPDTRYDRAERREAYRVLNVSKKVLERMLAEQYDFWDPAGWQPVLSLCLRNFSHAGNSDLGLEIYAKQPQGTPSPLGAKSIRRALCYTNWPRMDLQPGDNLRDHLACILGVVLKSPCHLLHLSILDEDWTVMPDFYALSSTHGADAFDSKLSRLQTLRLSIPTSASGYASVEGIEKLLACTSQLEKLALFTTRFSMNRAHNLFEQIAESTHLPHIKTLNLSLTWLNRDPVVAFLKKHEKTLERVFVDDCCYEDHWWINMEHLERDIERRVGSEKLTVEIARERYIGW